MLPELSSPTQCLASVQGDRSFHPAVIRDVMHLVANRAQTKTAPTLTTAIAMVVFSQSTVVTVGDTSSCVSVPTLGTDDLLGEEAHAFLMGRGTVVDGVQAVGAHLT